MPQLLPRRRLEIVQAPASVVLVAHVVQHRCPDSENGDAHAHEEDEVERRHSEGWYSPAQIVLNQPRFVRRRNGQVDGVSP